MKAIYKSVLYTFNSQNLKKGIGYYLELKTILSFTIINPVTHTVHINTIDIVSEK